MGFVGVDSVFILLKVLSVVDSNKCIDKLLVFGAISVVM